MALNTVPSRHPDDHQQDHHHHHHHLSPRTASPAAPTMEKSEPRPPPPGPPGPPGGWLCQRMSRPQEVCFNIMIAFLQLIPQATLTTVFPISRDIAQSFPITDPSVLPWLVAAYALSFGTFILVAGRLGDIFGHKNMVVLGYSWLSVWSLVAGLSHLAGYELFFIARGFQGLGASLMVPNGLALLGRTYPPGSKQKILAFTVFGLCAPVGAYLGMLAGALFTRFATWWWSFCALAMVTCVLSLAAQLCLVSPPPTPKQMRPVSEKLRDMDWLGAMTGVGGLLCIQVSLVSAPAAGWSTQYIYMLLVIGALLIVFFVITELKIAEQPLVPFKMLGADVGFVLGAVACGWAAFGVWTWFLWKYLLGVKHDTPLAAAIAVVPIVPVALIASVLTAWMMRKCAPAWTLFWALVAFTLGPLLLAIDAHLDHTSYWTWTFLSLVIMPFGMDMSFPAATLVMSNFFSPQQQGVAGSLISTVVNYSISLGLGLASTVEVQVDRHGHDPLAGIRGGWFTGVGLGGLGVLICVAFVVKSTLHPSPVLAPGPPRPVVGGSAAELGAAMPLTPRSADGRQARSNTVSSRATTMVPDTRSPQLIDADGLKLFNFGTPPSAPPSRPPSAPPSGASPWTAPGTSCLSPTSPVTSPKTTTGASTHKMTHRYGPPTRNESTQHLRAPSSSHSHSYASGPPASYSPFPPTFPAEPEAAYRGRGSWESTDDDRSAPWSVPGPSWEYRGSARSVPFSFVSQDTLRPGSRDRDVDGFGLDSRPIIPREMMGEKF